MSASLPKIVCTLGTTTDDAELLVRMVDLGMGLARINTAYASMEQMAQRIALLRSVSRVPLMLDIKGPQLRLHCTTERVDPDTGETVVRPCPYPISRGELIYVGLGQGPVCFNHGGFADDLQAGDLVTFDNGRIRARVVAPEDEGVDPLDGAVLLVVQEEGGGRLTPRMGANIPGKYLNVPRLSRRDLAALDMGVELGVEWFALSFARDERDVANLHRELARRGERDAGLILKVEDRFGVANLETMVQQVRQTGRPLAVMIARGDLFVELPPESLPGVQRDLLARCRSLEVASMVATGLLLSMQQGPRPARSEVCDVAAALSDGADSLMLSDETSNGKNPDLAVAMLARLVTEYGDGEEQP